MACAPKSLAMRRGEALHKLLEEALGAKPQMLFTSGTWDLNGPAQVLYMPAIDPLAYACLDAEFTANMYAMQTERKPMSKPRVTDAQVRLNQDTQWLAADVVFVSPSQLDAGAPYNGQRYTYKAPIGIAFKEGLLAHVIANGALRSVYIDKIRKPTTEDKLTAHAWLVVDGCYHTYAEAVKKDEELLAAIVKAQNDAKLEEDLRESLKRTAKPSPAAVEVADVTPTPGKLQLRVGGVYRAHNNSAVEIVGPNRTGLYQETHPFLADNGLTYTPEGLQDTLANYAADDATTSCDLISEVT